MKKKPKLTRRPSRIRSHPNAMRVSTRATLTKGYPVWFSVSECAQKSCPAYNECPFDKERMIKCKVQSDYLKACEEMIIANFAANLTDDELFQVGMHLYPLYKELCRLKIVEMGVKTVVLTGKTKKYIHPVFKEIRETVKAISQTWRDIDLKKARRVPDAPILKSEKDKYGTQTMRMVKGGNYYEAMEQEALKEGQGGDR